MAVSLGDIYILVLRVSTIFQLIALSFAFYFQVENKSKVAEVVVLAILAFLASIASVVITVQTEGWMDPDYKPLQTSVARWVALVAIWIAMAMEGTIAIIAANIDETDSDLTKHDVLQQAFFITALSLNGIIFIAMLIYQSERKEWVSSGSAGGGRRQLRRLVRKEIQHDLEKRGLLLDQ